MTIAATLDSFSPALQTDFRTTCAQVLTASGIPANASNIAITNILAGSIIVSWSLTGLSDNADSALTSNAQQIFSQPAALTQLRSIGVTAVTVPGNALPMSTQVLNCGSPNCLLTSYDLNPAATVIGATTTSRRQQKSGQSHPSLLLTAEDIAAAELAAVARKEINSLAARQREQRDQYEEELGMRSVVNKRMMQMNQAARGDSSSSAAVVDGPRRSLLQVVTSPNPTQVQVNFVIQGQQATQATNTLANLVREASPTLKSIGIVAAAYGGQVPVVPNVLPPGSFLSDYSSTLASFTPPSPGNYSFLISVRDKCSLVSRTVVVSAICSRVIPPLPDASYSGIVYSNITLWNPLNTTALYAYKWCLLQAPAGTNLTSTHTRDGVMLAGGVAGSGVVQLTVSDGCAVLSRSYPFTIDCPCGLTIKAGVTATLFQANNTWHGHVTPAASIQSLVYNTPGGSWTPRYSWSLQQSTLTGDAYGLYQGASPSTLRQTMDQIGNARVYTFWQLRSAVVTTPVTANNFVTSNVTSVNSTTIYPREAALPTPTTSTMTTITQSRTITTMVNATTGTTTTTTSWNQWCVITISNYESATPSISVNSYSYCYGRHVIQAAVQLSEGCMQAMDNFTINVECSRPFDVACSAYTTDVMYLNSGNMSAIQFVAFPTIASDNNTLAYYSWAVDTAPAIPYPWNLANHNGGSPTRNLFTVPYPWSWGNSSVYYTVPYFQNDILSNMSRAWIQPDWGGLYGLTVTTRTDCWVKSTSTQASVFCAGPLPPFVTSLQPSGTLTGINGTFPMLNASAPASGFFDAPTPYRLGQLRYSFWLQAAGQNNTLLLLASQAYSQSFSPVNKAMFCLPGDSDTRCTTAEGVNVVPSVTYTVMSSASDGCQAQNNVVGTFTPTCPSLSNVRVSVPGVQTGVSTTLAFTQQRTCPTPLSCFTFYNPATFAGSAPFVARWYNWMATTTTPVLFAPTAANGVAVDSSGQIGNYTLSLAPSATPKATESLQLTVSDGCTSASQSWSLTFGCTVPGLASALGSLTNAGSISVNLFQPTWVLGDASVLLLSGTQTPTAGATAFVDGVWTASGTNCLITVFFAGNNMMLTARNSTAGACSTAFPGIQDETFYNVMLVFSDTVAANSGSFQAVVASPSGASNVFRTGTFTRSSSTQASVVFNGGAITLPLSSVSVPSGGANWDYSSGSWSAAMTTLNTTITGCNLDFTFYRTMFTLAAWNCSVTNMNGLYGGDVVNSCTSTNGCDLRFTMGPYNSFLRGETPGMFQNLRLTKALSATWQASATGVVAQATLYPPAPIGTAPATLSPILVGASVTYSQADFYGTSWGSTNNSPRPAYTYDSDLQSSSWIALRSQAGDGCLDGALFYGRAAFLTSNCTANTFRAGRYDILVSTVSLPSATTTRPVRLTLVANSAGGAVPTYEPMTYAAACSQVTFTFFTTSTTNGGNLAVADFGAGVQTMSSAATRWVGPRYLSSFAWSASSSPIGGGPLVAVPANSGTISSPSCMVTPINFAAPMTLVAGVTGNAGGACPNSAVGNMYFNTVCANPLTWTGTQNTQRIIATVPQQPPLTQQPAQQPASVFSYASQTFPTINLAGQFAYSGSDAEAALSFRFRMMSSPAGSQWGYTLANPTSITQIVQTPLPVSSINSTWSTMPNNMMTTSPAPHYPYQLATLPTIQVLQNISVVGTAGNLVTQTITTSVESVLRNNKAEACFTPDVPGPYVVEFMVATPSNCLQPLVETLTVYAVCPPAPTLQANPFFVTTQTQRTDALHFGRVTLDYSSRLSNPSNAKIWVQWTVAAPGNGALIGVANANSNPASFVPAGSGVYNVTVTISDGCSTNSYSLPVTVGCDFHADVANVITPTNVVYAQGTNNAFPTVYLPRIATPTCLGEPVTITYLGRVCNDPANLPVPIVPPTPSSPTCQATGSTYWTLIQKPCNSNLTIGANITNMIMGPNGVPPAGMTTWTSSDYPNSNGTAVFVPDVPGDYILQFVIAYGCGYITRNVTVSAKCRTRLVATAEDQTVLYGCTGSGTFATLSAQVSSVANAYSPPAMCPVAVNASVPLTPCLRRKTIADSGPDCCPCDCCSLCSFRCAEACARQGKTVAGVKECGTFNPAQASCQAVNFPVTSGYCRTYYPGQVINGGRCVSANSGNSSTAASLQSSFNSLNELDLVSFFNGFCRAAGGAVKSLTLPAPAAACTMYAGYWSTCAPNRCSAEAGANWFTLPCCSSCVAFYSSICDSATNINQICTPNVNCVPSTDVNTACFDLGNTMPTLPPTAPPATTAPPAVVPTTAVAGTGTTVVGSTVVAPVATTAAAVTSASATTAAAQPTTTASVRHEQHSMRQDKAQLPLDHSGSCETVSVQVNKGFCSHLGLVHASTCLAHTEDGGNLAALVSTGTRSNKKSSSSAFQSQQKRLAFLADELATQLNGLTEDRVRAFFDRTCRQAGGSVKAELPKEVACNYVRGVLATCDPLKCGAGVLPWAMQPCCYNCESSYRTMCDNVASPAASCVPTVSCSGGSDCFGTSGARIASRQVSIADTLPRANQIKPPRHLEFGDGIETPARLRARISTDHSEPHYAADGPVLLDREQMRLRDILVNNSGVLELVPDPSDVYPLKPPPAFIAVIVVVIVLLVASVAVNVIVYKKVKGMDASGSIDMRG